LGIQYVLEGSVQKSGDQLRITAQLIDALSGHHIWSERYDRELKDIFDLQDDITINVMNNLVAELTEGEQVRRWTEKRVTNLKALEKHYQAQGFFCRHTKEDYEKARPLFEEAIALEPEFIYPYVYLGYLHNLTGYLGYSESPAKSYQTALELAQKALAIDDSHDGAHALMASCYNVRRQYDKALSEAERAIALNPNSSDGYLVMASALGYSGRWEESAIYAKKYIRINPFPGAYIYSILGRAYFMMGQYEESIVTWKKALKVSPNYLTAHRFLAACYSSIGRDEEARAAANEVLRINPKFTIESYEKRLGYKNKSDIKREVTALRKAGLPYKPPLPLPDKPSIAVLAFDNLSGDPEQEYFSDGIAEDIITALSKTPKLFVIARNSSFTYKGKPVKVQKVGRELGVRYVLEGSVRMAEGKVRITAQLIDAKTGHHLWAERYDKAISEGKRAIELDPNTSKWAVHYGWALRSVGRYEDALLEYKKALRLNPLDKARPLEQICTTYNMMRRHEEAIETCKKVIELSPRSLPSYINLAVAYGELDQKDEAREAADKVLKIYPNFSMDSFEKTLPYKNKADRDLYVNGLRKAGLK
jgi:TolB-like protein